MILEIIIMCHKKNVKNSSYAYYGYILCKIPREIKLSISNMSIRDGGEHYQSSERQHP